VAGAVVERPRSHDRERPHDGRTGRGLPCLVYHMTPDSSLDILREMSCIEKHLDRRPKRVIISQSIANELMVPPGPMWPKSRGKLWGVTCYVRPDFEVK
jgi:hypothetical protein